MLVQGAGQPMTVSGVSCAAASLSGYGEKHTGVFKDIISRKGVAADRGVGQNGLICIRQCFDPFF